MLIDLDLAKKLDGNASGARQQTGTVQFMAIGVLQKADHTYRHDLESFFYVLLWMCAYRSWERGFGGTNKKMPEACRIEKWGTGTFIDIAEAKTAHMTPNSFEDKILSGFPAPLEGIKPLCRNIRSLLFGSAGIDIEAPSGDPGVLYKAILDAYEGAITQLAGK
ncbi:hypothetical protein BJX63DRAFT_279816 [Aspergillus granulosus]|uniref:Fungal-type protein kinase domain-containing protein n=1 Tax=Aspergillus granulosus TaxID=176169 RepID=A0ABR4HYT3_9EURO